MAGETFHFWDRGVQNVAHMTRRRTGGFVFALILGELQESYVRCIVTLTHRCIESSKGTRKKEDDSQH
jgi:hypothetical protein